MINLFWFRRDLRLNDNSGLYQALKGGIPVLPMFIFDTDILSKLEVNDKRIPIIYELVIDLDQELKKHGSSLLILHGKPADVFKKLISEYTINSVFTNEDYEPYAIERDLKIQNLLNQHNIILNSFKDQVIFHKSEIMKDNNTPYNVFTAYSKKWNKALTERSLKENNTEKHPINFFQFSSEPPTLASIGKFGPSYQLPKLNLTEKLLKSYATIRNNPNEQTTNLSFHLRFGTVSIREIVNKVRRQEALLNELIWREFFMMIMFHYPQVVKHSFRKKYENIKWRNNEEDFNKWINGKTGFPIVDAGMRQLKETGHMHNRIRMVTASFLVKQLLIDWRWGEAYFASKLIDYELSSNNGNWQWIAGTGTDAAPYFRIFNPDAQLKRLDPEFKYVKKWIPEYGTTEYPKPMVDLKESKLKILEAYKNTQN